MHEHSNTTYVYACMYIFTSGLLAIFTKAVPRNAKLNVNYIFKYYISSTESSYVCT